MRLRRPVFTAKAAKIAVGLHPVALCLSPSAQARCGSGDFQAHAENPRNPGISQAMDLAGM